MHTKGKNIEIAQVLKNLLSKHNGWVLRHSVERANIILKTKSFNSKFEPINFRFGA